MRRIALLALALTATIGAIPAVADALPPGVVPGPNSITGTVTNADGTPLEGIVLTDSTFTTSTVSDIDGTYLLEGLQADNAYSVFASDPAAIYQETESGLVVVSATDTVVANIAMSAAPAVPTGSIHGVVTDADGNPLAGIPVQVGFDGNTITAADGSYSLTGLPLDFFVQVFASDQSGLHGSFFGEPVLPSEAGTTFDIALPTPVLDVTGTVRDADGAPLAGARVSDGGFFGTTSITGNDGRYGLSNLGDGPHTLEINPPRSRTDLRGTTADVDVVTGAATDVSVQLTRKATFEVTVTGLGVPADAQVSVWSALAFGGRVATGFTDAEGKVSLPIAFDGDYYLQVESRGTALAGEFFPDSVFRADAQRFTLLGEQHIAVAVDLEAAAAISGTVVFADGSPGDFTMAAAFPVGLAEGAFPDFAPCNLPLDTDPAGTFRIGCLHPSSDYLVKGFGLDRGDNEYYLDSQSAAHATPIAVAPGEEVSGIELTLPPKTPDPTFLGLSQQYFITGTTTPGVHVFGTHFPSDPAALQLDSTDFFGTPAVNFTVTDIVSSTEAIATVVVDAGTIGDIPQGRTLALTRSIGGRADCSCTLFVGDLNTPVAAAAGRVTTANGRGVGGVSIVLSSAAGNFRTAVTGSDGRWAAQGLVPDTYTVFFEGTETTNPQYWRSRTTAPAATPVPLAAGVSRTGLDAKLTPRGPIRLNSVTPRNQTNSLSFDLKGTGLASIAGGFRVSIPTFFGNLPLDVTSVSSSTLHVTGFAFAGKWDVVLEWTGADGTTKSLLCTQCLHVYDPLSAESFGAQVQRGTTSTVTLFGSGFEDITRVTVSGSGVTVRRFDVLDPTILDVTVQVQRGARVGTRAITVFRADGSRATTQLDVVAVPV